MSHHSFESHQLIHDMYNVWILKMTLPRLHQPPLCRSQQVEATLPSLLWSWQRPVLLPHCPASAASLRLRRPGSRRGGDSPARPAPPADGGAASGVPPASPSRFSSLLSARSGQLVPGTRVQVGNISSAVICRDRRKKECCTHFWRLIIVGAEGMGNGEPCSCLLRSRPLLMTVVQSTAGSPWKEAQSMRKENWACMRGLGPTGSKVSWYAQGDVPEVPNGKFPRGLWFHPKAETMRELTWASARGFFLCSGRCDLSP